MVTINKIKTRANLSLNYANWVCYTNERFCFTDFPNSFFISRSLNIKIGLITVLCEQGWFWFSKNDHNK